MPLLLGPAIATSIPATAQVAAPDSSRSATADESLTLRVAPDNSSILHLNQDLQLSVTVTNDTAKSVAAGTVDVYLAERALTTRSALDAWLEADDETGSGELMTSVPLLADLQPHSSVTISVTVAAASLELFEWSTWGPRGIAASLRTDDTVRTSGRTTFVWYPDTSQTQTTTLTPVNLAVAMPITAPANTTGLISADDLTAYTAPSGILSRQLDGVLNRPVAIAIDPMIIASIRILGTTAPASAIEWLDRLDQGENEIFPLGYADADLSLAAQAGAASPLGPVSLTYATDPELFVPTAPSAAPAGSDQANTQTPTPSETAPADQPGQSTVPTLEELVAWDYTSTSIVWPAENAVAQSDLAAFKAAGLTTAILASGNVSRSSADATANTTMDLGSGELGLAADIGISQALAAAIQASTDDDWRGAMAEVSSQIAVVAAENPGKAHTLLATLDRGWPPTAARLSQTIDALAALPWYSSNTLTSTITTPVSSVVSFVPQAEPAASVDLARRLIDREAELMDFAGALADPESVTAPNRLALLALLGTAWQSSPADWRTAVGDNLAGTHEVLRSVTVSTKGPINVVGSKVDIPVTLNNALAQAVTVRVQVIPSNGRLVVGGEVEAVLDASSAKTVSIPVTAAVGNGAVTLRVTLFTPAGAMMGPPSPISVNVRADWEGIGSRIFAALVVLFFGFGVWRNIVHRRRDRALASAEPDAGPADDLEAVPVADSGANPAPEHVPSDSTAPSNSGAAAEAPEESPSSSTPDDLPTAPRA